jgi:hypothetical protein
MNDLTNPFDEMDTVSALLNDGLERGYITYDQILEALPEVENNLMLLEAILDEAQVAGIPVYENNDEASLHVRSNGDADAEGDAFGGANNFFANSYYRESPHAAP